jgi:hypothetical protein
VGYGAGKAVELPDNYDLEFSFVCVSDEAVQLWAAFLGTRNANVYVFPHQRPAAPLAIFTNLSGLNFGVLVI